ncbi:hypothetical protein L3X38_015090 [Prunus dulcis]|uniref:Uncharacterized protein n=1 Tax=Prunus dulcis TaxID=3755 RepID=A0AAD4ZIX4_PRUDU|nr:hypothetical protein L3X38_015090 [Prunus dulcis]
MKTKQGILTCGGDGEGHILKRIARIKFPQRHLTPKIINLRFYLFTGSVPTPPKNAAAGGKASLQPELGWMHLILNLNLMME